MRKINGSDIGKVLHKIKRNSILLLFKNNTKEKYFLLFFSAAHTK